jgi:hypothetical protein
MNDKNRPLCQVCRKPVEDFKVGKDFRRDICFYESRCHGEIDRFEYRPLTQTAALFEPAIAFPSERPPSGDIATNAAPPRPNILSVQDELVELPAWTRLTRLRQLARSQRLLERNAAELQDLLRYLTTDPKSMALLAVSRRAEFDIAIEELLRRLHNFVASAKTLVDHTRVVYQELYEGTGTFEDYHQEIVRRFTKDPLVQFVQRLRQLAQHERLPQISFTLSANQGGPIVRRLLLNKPDLLKFNGWNAPSKSYLSDAPESIDLTALVEAYVASVSSFYQWLQGRWEVLHANDAAEVENKQAEGIALLAEQVPAMLESGLLTVARGAGDLKNIFSFGLAPADWLELAQFDDDMTVWAEEALKMFEMRFGALPADLSSRIRQAARTA